MKAYRLFVKENDANSYSLSGYKVLHDDGVQHDDMQTLFAALMRFRYAYEYLLWDDGDYVTFDDGSRIRIN